MTGSPDLDPGSRRTLRWLTLRLVVVGSTSGVVAALAVDRPAAQFLLIFQVLCFWASLLAVAFALSTGEQPRRGVLGFWDEALVFGALALLAHIGLRAFRP